MFKKNIIILLSFILFFCENKRIELPIYGIPIINSRILENGSVTYDTLDHTIQNFKLFNQNGDIITNETFNNKIYIADFFFTTCPTICRKMKRNLLHVYKTYEDNKSISFVSHTIDPKNDTIEKLKEYSENLEINDEKWHFLTGDLDEIYNLGENSYMVAAMEDNKAPGGFLHGSAFLLVDTERRIRGVYDGTSRIETNRLIIDINNLIKSY